MSDQHVAPQTHITGDANAVGHGKITLLIKAEGGSTIRGVVQQVFGGDYERLRDAYIHPWPVFERVNLDHFVGREWLLAEVDAFLRDHDRGYFILEAEAGLGKTTFLAWLVRERGYIHHFTELAPGLDGIGRGLKNLAAQLVLAYQLSAYEAEGVLPGAVTRPDYLYNLLKQVANRHQDGEKTVLVVDALDEAGTPYNQNVLGLPQVLPEGVFIIVSQRPVPVALQVDTATTPRRCFPLAADSDENQADMRRFFERAATWPVIAQSLHDSGYTPEQFTTSLLEKCRGVWIYLHYVIHEIERGERSPLDLDALPDGMTQYYARYWQRWRDADEDKWYEVYLPLLTTLAAAQEAVAVERLAEWADVGMPVRHLRRLLNERWRPFLTIAGQGQNARYRFYHATLREFFNGRVEREKLTAAEEALVSELTDETCRIHCRLVERYLAAWGGMDKGLPGLQEAVQRGIDEGYGLRHLVAHLEASGRVEDLHRLLAVETSEQRNVWYEVKEAIDDAAGYLTDVIRAWRLVEETCAPTDSEHAGRGIGLQCRYALITASLNSLAKNIPPALLVALVEKGIWTPAKGLAYARQVPDLEQRARALLGLAPYLPEREGVLREALAAAREVGNEYDRVEALVGLAPRLPEELLWEALAVAREVGDEHDRVRALVGLAPRLPEELLWEALAAAREIEWEPYRAEALAGLTPYLPEELLWEALAATRKIEDADDRARALAGLAPHLPETERSRAIIETAAARREIEAELELHQSYGTYNSGQPYTLEDLLRALVDVDRAKADDETITVQSVNRLLYELQQLVSGAPELLGQIIPTVGKLVSYRTEVWHTISPAWTVWGRQDRQAAYRVWVEALHDLTTSTRPKLCLDLGRLAPVIAKLGGEEAITETFRAIQDVCRWWP